MGRLASKRKIKQCDPFFKGKRDGEGDKYDRAPTVSKRKKRKDRKMLDQAAIDRFVLGGDASSSEAIQTKKKRKKNEGALADVEGRRPGESMRAFNQRMGLEVRKVLYHEAKKDRKSNAKKKEFFSAKKEKLKRKKMTDQEKYDLEYQETGSTKRDTFSATEKVRFGDRYDAPPILPVLKGVFKKKADAKTKK
ncbi:hypothetical protein SPRG_20864 [Saprolegnia parasitica CBS 223.65]|uniref:Uncharacterized protein n=1 Tax=Saprolegnia parasitica (strain CBS 223.65) TaxID=695850 RepID=A0A067C0Y2_SAPPC|nr:hypothetical protein SPRG_20864 [Saprolegnia parasitica CBS 223.65]KDO24459.1 hypothetical protein SPRG_20864 [Saprolegnia parasitica CBS 223.65]|eukprot:XP_012204895.1 hypothetical protein SPRG_20864 [Saprolegnia parasitica CBS 223.65]